MSGFPSTPYNGGQQLDTDAPAKTAAAFLDAFEKSYKEARLNSALKRIGEGDEAAIGDLMRVNPDLALSLQKQLQEKKSNAALGEYVVKSNGDDPNMRAAIDAGADPSKLVMTNTRQSRVSSATIKNVATVHGEVMSILGAVPPGDDLAWAQARARVKTLYGNVGLDTSYVDNLPSSLTPALKQQLINEGMDTSKQLTGAISQGRLDETVRHNGVTEGISQQRADSYDKSVEYGHSDRQEGFDVSRENNIRTTTTSSENNQRSTAQSNTNSERQAETTRGSATYQGRGRGSGRSRPAGGGNIPEGTRARNKRDGRMYVRRGGQWVPE